MENNADSAGEKTARYSEDFQRLIRYKQNVTPEATEDETCFFFEKYRSLIERYCTIFCRNGITASLKHSHTDKIDFDERDGFMRDKAVLLHERRLFMQHIRRYVSRALEHFDPEKIETKSSYSFASYLDLWLKTGLRDLSRQHERHRLNSLPGSQSPDMEAALIEKIDAELLRKRLSTLLSRLSPEDQAICRALSEGKKQKEIQIPNEKTGEPYSPGYICKRIGKIRALMEAEGVSAGDLPW